MLFCIRVRVSYFQFRNLFNLWIRHDYNNNNPSISKFLLINNFGFSRYIYFVMHLEIIYIKVQNKS